MLLSVESPRGAELELTCWERLGRGEVLIRQTMKSVKIKQKKLFNTSLHYCELFNYHQKNIK